MATTKTSNAKKHNPRAQIASKKHGNPVRRRSASARKQGIVRTLLRDATSYEAPPPLYNTQLVPLIEKGFAYQEVEDLADALGISLSRMAELMRTSKATLQRRKASGRLAPAESDVVLRYANLLRTAARVMGNQEYGAEWLRDEAYGLAGKRPLDYARSEAGAEEVTHLLGRIEHGVLA